MHGSEGLAGGEAGKAAIYSVELSMFEGPLDLLLHLVRRHELDILDIPISFVAEKYLEYLHLMRALDLEVAGDYLVMAATLAWLKSRELLPPEPREGEAAGADDEEGEDPREALIRRLVEYERFKSAAAELDAMPVSGRDVFARGADIDVPPLDPGLAPVTLFRLAEAYYRVLTRAKINKTHDVTIEAVTVAQRMQQLTLMLDERQEFDFEGLFLSRTWASETELRSMLVVTLMSVLELVKLGVARVQQVPDTDAIRVYRLVASEEARKLIETYDEEQSFGAPVEPGPAQPTEAELDAIEERTLLAEALAGLDGTEEPPEPADEIGVLAEVLDPEALAADDPPVILDEADLGPEAIAAAAANSDPAGELDSDDAPQDPPEAPARPDVSGSVADAPGEHSDKADEPAAAGLAGGPEAPQPDVLDAEPSDLSEEAGEVQAERRDEQLDADDVRSPRPADATDEPSSSQDTDDELSASDSPSRIAAEAPLVRERDEAPDPTAADATSLAMAGAPDRRDLAEPGPLDVNDASDRGDPGDASEAAPSDLYEAPGSQDDVGETGDPGERDEATDLPAGPASPDTSTGERDEATDLPAAPASPDTNTGERAELNGPAAPASPDTNASERDAATGLPAAPADDEEEAP